MGKPIKSSNFGTPVTAGSGHIAVSGVKFSTGATATNAYIVKQTGATAYRVSDGTHNEIVFMVNATSTSALQPGQCYILATPYGGATLPCYKIQQFRLTVYNTDGSFGNYSWSTIPAAAAGEADLILAAGETGPTETVLPAVSPTTGAHPQLLTASNGTWTGSTPMEFSYQWNLVGTGAIAGATSQTYTAAAAGTYSVTVTAHNAAGSASATSTTNAVIS